jgi:hypothetical protein
MTVVLDKLAVLKDTYTSEADLERVLGKLLDTVLGQQRLRMQRYEAELRQF